MISASVTYLNNGVVFKSQKMKCRETITRHFKRWLEEFSANILFESEDKADLIELVLYSSRKNKVGHIVLKKDSLYIQKVYEAINEWLKDF